MPIEYSYSRTMLSPAGLAVSSSFGMDLPSHWDKMSAPHKGDYALFKRTQLLHTLMEHLGNEISS